jgi:hypothetical protein
MKVPTGRNFFELLAAELFALLLAVRFALRFRRRAAGRGKYAIEESK